MMHKAETMGSSQAKPQESDASRQLRKQSDWAPVQVVADMGSWILKKFSVATQPLSDAELNLLPPLWRDVVTLAATTPRESMLVELLARNKAYVTEHGVAGEGFDHKQEGRSAADAPILLQQFATVEELTAMSKEPLNGKWLDLGQQRRWGIDRLAPGDHILYNRAFGRSYATHHSVYLGFIRRHEFMSPAVRKLLHMTITSMRAGSAAPCVEKYVEEFRQGLQGGLRSDAGIHLIMEVSVNKAMETRIHVMTMKEWAFNGSALGGDAYVVRDERTDVMNVREDGTPVWLARAMCCLGRIVYNVQTLNCEHFATFVTTGIYASQQASVLERSIMSQNLATLLIPGVRTFLPMFAAAGKHLSKRIERAKRKRVVDTVVESEGSNDRNVSEIV